MGSICCIFVRFGTTDHSDMLRAAVRRLAVRSSQAPRILSSHFRTPHFLACACDSNMTDEFELRDIIWSKNPGMDFKHWFVQIGGPTIAPAGLTRLLILGIEKRFNLYIKTLAKVVGSEEEAMKKIYKLKFEGEYGIGAGIGCEIDWATANVLRRLPYVVSVRPEVYENEGEFSLIDGKLVERGTGRVLEIQLSSSVLEKSWIELLSSSTPSPWLLLPPPAFGDNGQFDKVHRFYSIAEKKEFCIDRNEEVRDEDVFVGSSHGWLALFRPSTFQLFLSNPLSGLHLDLPSLHTLPFGEVGKVILSCSPQDCCRAVMIFGPESQLAFCWPGRSPEWTPLGSNSKYSDVLYSHTHNLFFCGLEGWDLSDPVCPRMVEENKFKVAAHYPADEVIFPLEKLRIHQVKHLVLDEQSEELFIVMRGILKHQSGWGYYVQSSASVYPHITTWMKMFKIDKDRKGCICCPEELNGLAMFVGTNHSFALPAAEFPELDEDCIFYSDEKRLIPWNWASLPYGAPDVDVYNYRYNFFYSRDCGLAWANNLDCRKHGYGGDARVMKRVPPLPMWFTPSLR